jgi:hypothetical protein
MITNYSTLEQEIYKALEEPDPILANLQITRCHYRLSQDLQQILGQEAGANFHSWAVWGSRKAGVTIRQEDLDQAQRDGTIVGSIVGGLVGLLCGLFLSFPVWLQPGALLLGASCGVTFGRFIIRRSRKRAAELILAGNRTVLADIGLQTARFIKLFFLSSQAQPKDLAHFLRELQASAPKYQSQQLLEQAFTHYFTACTSHDIHVKQEATYLANCFAVWHEHVRLEPYIRGAMPRIIRRCVTKRLLQFDIGSMRLAVSQDVPASMNNILMPEGPVTHTHSQALVLLSAIAGEGVVGLRQTQNAAQDWTRIQERMRYVFALFRAYHNDPSVRDAPYTKAQLTDIGAGQYAIEH